MASRLRTKLGKRKQEDSKLFTLEVCIVSGPMTDRFVKKNRVVSRTIQIRADQNLEVLHGAIFTAFNREEEHMYEFQVGGKRPMDPKAKRYVLPHAIDDCITSAGPAGDVTNTTIGSLGLRVNDSFGYWFDFGDDWMHQINVLAVDNKVPPGKYPKVIKKVGAAPPQYVNWEEKEEEE
jgi:hypothetical protein